MSDRACDICRTAAAARVLVRSDLGGADDRMLACNACKPPEGEWQSYGLDGAALARDYAEKRA